MTRKRIALYAGLACIMVLAGATWLNTETPRLRPLPAADGERFQVLDRDGKPLGVSYQSRFNTSDLTALSEMPDLLWRAFVTAEDRQFFQHHGVDWRARLGAITQNVEAGRAVRGASTITEQVVRIIHPRPRNLWSRWLEGFEAMRLEAHASKGQILEFYLNQVPYAANRRGVGQAARYYFNRDVTTLTPKEILALAVLPRAPSTLDLYKTTERIAPAIERLATALQANGDITPDQLQAMASDPLVLEPPPAPLSATHFINYIRETVPYTLSENGVLRTTLDSGLQAKAQKLLDERLRTLTGKRVHHGAVMIADHATGEILAWAVAGATDKKAAAGSAIDAVRVPRQPGSSLKPFLYTLALDSGWSPATELDDAPMAEAIGSGLHDFHNYSHIFYGKLPLREALGNSLNIPALETIQFVGVARYLDTLHALGFANLSQSADFYRDGLALGNGEVTLFEMVQAYAALANRGVSRALTPLLQTPYERASTKVYSPEAASLVGNILSDPFARRREFGAGSVLNLAVQTAVKTGTSTDYHDAWVMGYNSNYVVGVWLGNLDQSPMDGVTGATGPALVMRSLFAELVARKPARSLYLSPRLIRQEVCKNGLAAGEQAAEDKTCFPRTEYFVPGSEPGAVAKAPVALPTGLTFVRPTEGLHIAYDPRVPASKQAFEFVASNVKGDAAVEWVLNDAAPVTTQAVDGTARYLWPLARGAYTLTARVAGDGLPVKVNFVVK